MTPHDISVVIPAINEAAAVGRAIASALAAGAGEVVVADGGSRDETPVVAEASGALVIHAPPGRARQQNAGARQARGAVLLFLHADNHLAAAALQQVVRALENSRRHWGAFRQHIDDPARIFRWIERGNAARVRWRGLPFGDQGIFVRRELFWNVGGFPDEPLMEDLMLAARLRRRAWPLLLPGPLYVDARRWQARGPLRQTLRNWRLQAAFALGFSPGRLAAQYPRHDA
jgi:rSAM/selenodomain-associated transferase 2